MVIILLGYSTKEGWMKKSFGGGDLEMNEAILCTTNILKIIKGKMILGPLFQKMMIANDRTLWTS